MTDDLGRRVDEVLRHATAKHAWIDNIEPHVNKTKCEYLGIAWEPTSEARLRAKFGDRAIAILAQVKALHREFFDIAMGRIAAPVKTSDDLLPCPFCGGEPRVVKGSVAFEDIEIACDTCGFSGPNFGAIDNSTTALTEACRHWNTRFSGDAK